MTTAECELKTMATVKAAVVSDVSIKSTNSVQSQQMRGRGREERVKERGEGGDGDGLWAYQLHALQLCHKIYRS